MTSATPAAHLTAVPYQSSPPRPDPNPVQQTAQETFNTPSFLVTLPAGALDEPHLIIQTYNSGSSTAFKVCCAVSSIFGSNALQEALQVAFLDDPDSLDVVEYIQNLVKQGANPNLPPTSFSDNPAFKFLSNRDINQEQKIGFLKWLLQHGADPNHNNSSEPLYQAVNKRNLEAVTILLEYGANPNLPCRSQKSLIQEAFFYRSGEYALFSTTFTLFYSQDEVEIIKRLIEKGADPNVDSNPCFDNPAFTFFGSISRNANQTQRIEFLRWLLEHGADPNLNNSSEPLYGAINEGNLEAVIILLEHGANPNLPCRDGQSLIQYAFSSTHFNNTDEVEIIKRLIEKGVSPNLPSTPVSDNPAFKFLTWPSMNRAHKIDFLNWLLEHGADPNHNKSSEPLYRAIHDGLLEAVNILLEHGANPNLPCRDGRSLIRGAFSTSYLFCNQNKIEIIKRLIEEGADPNVDSTCVPYNPAFVFLSNQDLDQTQKIGFLKWLLQHKADPNHNNSSEPLYRAIYECNLEAIEILLQYGANPDLICSTDIEYRRSAKAFAKKARPQIYTRFWGPIPEDESPGNHIGDQKNYYAVILQAALQLEKTTFEPNSVFEDLRQKIIDCRSAEALLGLEPSCSKQEVKRAYKRLSRIVHPDKNDNSQPSIVLFQCLNAAHQILTTSP